MILELNRAEIESVADFNRAYRAAKRSVLLLINRQGSTVYLALRG